MRRLFFFACMSLLLPFGAGAQATENPDDMFGGNMVQSPPGAGASGAAQGAPTGTQAASGGTQATSAGTQPPPPRRRASCSPKAWISAATSIPITPATPSGQAAILSFSDPASGLTSSFVPNLEADVYLDARPYSFFRVFGKLKAIYPFGGSAQGVYQAQTNPFASIYTPPSGSSAAIPNISVFELFADVNWNEKLFLRVGQQVIHWGVGTFFSPADILSLSPINPLQPNLERQGPLALTVNVPFASVDSASVYVIANQAFAQNRPFDPSDLAVAPKVELLLGDYEVGVGGYYQRAQRPKAMMTATGSLFGTLGIFGEGVVSYGSDRTFAGALPGARATGKPTLTQPRPISAAPSA